MKRLCIYLIYDKEKIVDNYIGYMLSELKTCVDYLVVVCNMTEVVQGKDILESYADEIYYRENIGLDVGGFKDALTKFVGWSKVLSFDELVLINDSIFGPFCPMKDIFRVMDNRSVDFWGLTGHGEYMGEDLGAFSEHIQSFFIATRSSMLHSSEFRNYWEDMPYYISYRQTVREHEMRFTPYFFGLGYTYGFLADMEKNNSMKPANNYCQYRMIPYELIKKHNFPFLKKQQIAENRLENQTQESVYRAIDYIDKLTNYDVDLIWSNIIRTLDITDLQRSLHLQYVIPEKFEYTNCYKKIMIIVFISYTYTAECVWEYLEGINFEIKIISQDDKLLNDYKKYGFECEMVPLESMGEFLKKYSDYDLVCLIKDVDVYSKEQPNYIEKSYFFNVWNNLIGNRSHLLGILELFEKNFRLGMLTSPEPNFGIYLGDMGRGWAGKFKEIQRIVKEKELNCQISEDKPPFRAPESLWVRGEILAKLQEWQVEEFKYLPYLWSYIAQDAGYYSGIVESSEYAAINEVNLHYYLEQIVKIVRDNYGDFDGFFEMKECLMRYRVREFCEKYSHILVYGTGILARRYKSLMPRPEAYVVSDGQAKSEEFDGVPVKYLSELKNIDDCGIVLCMDKKNQGQVIQQLAGYGIKNYLCM